MATTYTTSLRLPIPQPLDPATSGQWGPLVDAMATLTDQAIAGIATVAVTTNPQTLTTANGASDQARPVIQQYTGTLTADTTINLPNVPKVGWAQNLTVGGFNIIESAGAGTDATIPSDGSLWFRTTDGVTDAQLPNVGFGALKTATSVIVGTTLTTGSNIVMPNNTAIRMNDTGGTPRDIIFLGSNNTVALSSAGNNGWHFLAQDEARTLVGIDTSGTTTFQGVATGQDCTISLQANTNGGGAVIVASRPSPPHNFTSFRSALATTGSFHAIWTFQNVISGSVSVGAGNTTNYNTTSDQTLKIDDGPMDDIGRMIDQIKPRWFRWKSAPQAEPEPGFFAQQVNRIFPWAVTKGRGRKGSKHYVPWQMDNSKLVPVLVAELQSLRRRVRELERCLSAR